LIETDSGNNYFEDKSFKRFTNKYKRFRNIFIKFMDVYLIIDLFLAIIISIILIKPNISYKYDLMASYYLYYLLIKDVIFIFLIIIRLINFIINITSQILFDKTKEEEKSINLIVLISNIIITVIINLIMYGWGLRRS
jgi:hypothetical protein